MIPNKFNLLGQEIIVVIDSQYCYDNNCIGKFFPYENKIVLADKYKTKRTWRKYKEDIIYNTFLHELVHCFLYHTGHTDLWLDEVLVTSLAGMIQQWVTSSKYD